MTIALIDIYKTIFSGPLNSILGLKCRFQPTCSTYAKESFRKNGFLLGSFKSIKRILRCHPWGDFGFDPVENDSNVKKGFPRGK